MALIYKEVVDEYFNFFHHPSMCAFLKSFYDRIEAAGMVITTDNKKTFARAILNIITNDEKLLRHIRQKRAYNMPGDWHFEYACNAAELVDVFRDCVKWVADYEL